MRAYIVGLGYLGEVLTSFARLDENPAGVLSSARASNCGAIEAFAS